MPAQPAYRTDFDWSRECRYINKATIDALSVWADTKAKVLKEFNGDPACLARYCENQRDLALRDDKPAVAAFIRSCLDQFVRAAGLTTLTEEQEVALRSVNRHLGLNGLPSYGELLDQLAYLVRQSRLSDLPETNHALQGAARLLVRAGRPT